MTREEIIDGLKFTVEMFLLDPNTGETFTEPRNDMDKKTIDACRGAIELLKQKPCDDAVSRQAVLEFFKDDDYVVNEINNMPSVVPKREQGKWRQNGTGYDDEPIYVCSKCGKRVTFGEDGYFKGCPYCFAEMIERSENEMR